MPFLTYDDEHHRFAFVNLGEAKDCSEKPRAMAPGLNHLAYTWRNIEELMDTYTRLKSRGIMPTRPIRHGPTLSLCYRDPDGNGLEFQIDRLEEKDANEFMGGRAFPANPMSASRPISKILIRIDQSFNWGTDPYHARTRKPRYVNWATPELLVMTLACTMNGCLTLSNGSRRK